MATSATKPYGASNLATKFQQSVSPSHKFSSASMRSYYATFANSMPSFSSATKSSPPNPTNDARWGPPLASVNRRCVSPPPSVRFSVEHRKPSPDRTVASPSSREKNPSGIHVNSNKPLINPSAKTIPTATNREFYFKSYRLYLQKSAMKKSIVRMGRLEGDLEKRALASLIPPLPRQKIWRNDFPPRPSRLSAMSKTGD